MHKGEIVGRVGGLAVALGIGSAVALGVGCGVAAAEDAAPTSAPANTDPSGSSSAGSSDGDDGTDRESDHPSDEDDTSPTDVETEDAEPTEDTEDTEEDDPTEDDDRTEQKPGTTAVRAVSTTDDDIRSSSRRSQDPAEVTAALGLVTAAGREVEQAEHVSDNAAVAPQPSIGLAPGIVVPPALEGHYEVTGSPSLSDRVTLFAMEVLDKISDVIGVNIVMTLGEAILSPKPPWFTTLGLDVERSEYEGGDVWTITPPDPTGEVVVAVHGSGFVYPPNIIHWLDYTQMARQTGATVVVPRYPLIPDGGTAANTIPPMATFIAAQVEAHGADHVSVYGDSAGGTLAMLAVQMIVRECDGDADCLARRVPSKMVLLSTALNGPGSYTDPNVVLVNDPVIDVPVAGQWPAWEGDVSNPMLGPTEGLPATAVYVGSREMIAPGALAYGEHLLTANPDAEFHVIIGMGQIHNWAQGGGLPINSQAGNYRDDVYRQLGIA